MVLSSSMSLVLHVANNSNCITQSFIEIVAEAKNNKDPYSIIRSCYRGHNNSNG